MQKELLAVISVACVLSACFGGGGKGEGGSGNRKASNRPPTISGAPPSTILPGEAYEFTPTASDPDGDTLEFKILNKPVWATFEQTTGRLAGTPDAAAVGQYSDISISVSDGRASAVLSAFDIDVDSARGGLGDTFVDAAH